MEKDFIDEFISSKDTRTYLHSIHHEFTDLEKAIIVANHIMISYEKKVKWLEQFMDEITDNSLRNRILKAISQIREDKQYYNERNIASGNIPYSESLFEFVFIPHNFRHGDIVRSLYGNWNTTMFNEKIGIILSYFDDDYELYKNLRGDYSDVQVCVDIKFDGVAYQGEFEHEHINPIYIERMSLNEKDERIAYLKYLTNLYSKNRHMSEVENKPEYAGGTDDLLEQRYLGEYIPVYDDTSGIWCVQTGHGFERGAVDYIAAEFSGTGFHFIKDMLPQDFEVCLIIEKNGHLSAGCWDTGLWSTENGNAGRFRQSRGGVFELNDVLAWLPIEETTINIKELWWNPEYRLIAILLNCVMVFAKDADKYLTVDYYGGNEKKIVFHMDVTTGNILEIDENGRGEIYYLQSTMRAWYDDLKEKLLEGYYSGRYTVLPKWEE